MSDTYPNKDEIELYKPFMEIAKYAVAVVSAFAAFSAAILKTGNVDLGIELKILLAICLTFNITVFLLSHRVFSEASALVTTRQSVGSRESGLENLKSRSYSLFVTVYFLSLVAWTGLLGWVILIA